MTRYEYKVTRRLADEFSQVVYFCGLDGSCGVERVPGRQIDKVSEILNDEGRNGWDLVQIAFGKNGMLMFWKRMIPEVRDDPAESGS